MRTNDKKMDKIADFENKHAGERAFFVGCGPSLSDTPLADLKNEWTFSSNKIHKIYGETDWRPDYYKYMPSRSRETDINTVNKNMIDDTTVFVSEHCKEDLQLREDIIYIECEYHKDSRIECMRDPKTIPNYAYELWSDDLKEIVYGYNNTIYIIFQLINYMGFDELYLVGCDLGIDTDWYPIFENAPEPKEFKFDYRHLDGNTEIELLRRSDEKFKSLINILAYKFPSLFETFYQNESHFSGNYLGFTANIKRGTDAAQRRAHRLGRIKLQERDIDVYNATIGGELEVHPRVNLLDLI